MKYGLTVLCGSLSMPGRGITTPDSMIGSVSRAWEDGIANELWP